MGDGVIVTIKLSFSSLQEPLPVVVKYNFTLPVVISVAPGVYVVFNAVGTAKDPSPTVDQIPPAATVTVPFKETSTLFAQTV